MASVWDMHQTCLPRTGLKNVFIHSKGGKSTTVSSQSPIFTARLECWTAESKKTWLYSSEYSQGNGAVVEATKHSDTICYSWSPMTHILDWQRLNYTPISRDIKGEGLLVVFLTRCFDAFRNGSSACSEIILLATKIDMRVHRLPSPRDKGRHHEEFHSRFGVLEAKRQSRLLWGMLNKNLPRKQNTRRPWRVVSQ